jgi:hypothetical protein
MGPKTPKQLRHDVEMAGLALMLIGSVLYAVAGIIPDEKVTGPVFVEVKPDDG